MVARSTRLQSGRNGLILDVAPVRDKWFQLGFSQEEEGSFSTWFQSERNWSTRNEVQIREKRIHSKQGSNLRENVKLPTRLHSGRTAFILNMAPVRQTVVIYPPYTHNRHFLQPSFPFISHASFIIKISTITIYFDWHSSLGLGDIEQKQSLLFSRSLNIKRVKLFENGSI